MSTTTTTIEVTFKLERNGESTTRKISFPQISAIADYETTFENVREKFKNEYKYAIQPTSWRDNDLTEEAWQCKGVDFVIVTKTESEYGDSATSDKTDTVINFDSSTNIVTFNTDGTVYYTDKSSGNTATVQSGNVYNATSNWVFYSEATANYSAGCLIVS